jgi:C-terminal processing protease CtpA/Prc
MLAGPSGTSVRLGFFREADDEAGRAVELSRQDLSALRVVSERRGTDAAALRVTDTGPGVAKLVAAELARLEKLGVRSLVLDLRANVGGTPQDAAALASVFAGPGVMFQRLTRTGASSVEGGEAKAWPFKLVVLISRATLGEGELVAEALRVRLGVPVIGQPTFGKTSQQDLVLLSDGTGLIMSVAEYRRADGSALPVKGLDPDEKIASRRAEPALVEPHAEADADTDDEDGGVSEPSPDASGGASPGDASPQAPPANKFPAPEGVSPPVLPRQPLPTGQPGAAGASPADDASDPQLDRAFEILAGAPLKKAA